MPRWLYTVALFNPLSHVVDALRACMLQQGVTVVGFGVDAAVTFAAFLLLLLIAACRDPSLVA